MNDLRLAVAEAIRRVSHQVTWKPGKDLIHFRKRQALGHLGATATLMETAFPPDGIEGYLAQVGFTEIGTVEELLK